MMNPERDKSPNFQRLVEMGTVDDLLKIAEDTKRTSEHREAAIDHLHHFFGTDHNDAIKGFFPRLAAQSNLPEEVASALNNAKAVFDLVDGHTEDIDYLLNLIRENQRSQEERVTIFAILRRFEKGERAAEIRSIGDVITLRESLEAPFDMEDLDPFN